MLRQLEDKKRSLNAVFNALPPWVVTADLWWNEHVHEARIGNHCSKIRQKLMNLKVNIEAIERKRSKSYMYQIANSKHISKRTLLHYIDNL